MKTTGVVRRIDDLGRIVIPKEIRRNLRIRDGESMEIFVDNEFIALKKYSSLDELNNIAEVLVDSINKEIEKNVFITDMDVVIAYSGVNKKKYISKNISPNLEQIINERKGMMISKHTLQLVDGVEITGNFVIYPIISNGDVTGSIVAFSQDNIINDSEEQLIKVVATFLGNHIES